MKALTVCTYRESKYDLGLCYDKGILASTLVLLTILGPWVKMIGGPIWPLNECENLHFENEWDIHMSSKNYEENGCYRHGLDLHLAQITSFISYEKWVQREKYPHNTRPPYSLAKWSFFFILNDHIGPTNYLIKINYDPRIVIKIWSHSLISFEKMLFWCPFLDPYLTRFK